MEYTQVPGFGAAVVRVGTPVWKYFTGLADVDSKRAIEENSLFPAASLGKPVFARGVLQLASNGLLDLDRPLDTYLQDETFSGELAKKVTARHVLSHTTGFVNWRGGLKRQTGLSIRARDEIGARWTLALLVFLFGIGMTQAMIEAIRN